MDITFKTKKQEKIFNSEKELKKAYGTDNAVKIMRRLAVLRAASSLADVPATPPERCHPHSGSGRGHYTVDVKQPFRLIFEAVPPDLPMDDRNQVILAKITAIRILGMEDMH
jgi:proteic killer suppression protein